MSTNKFSHLKLLAIFAVVVEHQSFAAAARKLHSSRSRISEQVALLEEALGIRLLQRSTRKLQLTDEGRAIYQQAIKLDGLLQQVEAIASPSEPSGRVSITLNQDIAHQFLLPRLRKFQLAYPKIHLDLMLDDHKRDLIAEQIDLAIRIGFPKDSNLVARVMHEEKFALFATPQFLATEGEPHTLAELQDKTWILMDQVSGANIIRLKQGDQSIEVKPKEFYRCNSPYMVQKMVMEHMGVAVMLPGTVKADINKGKLVQLMPEIGSDTLVFSLVYPSRKQMPARTKTVINFLLEENIFS